ncbi:DNA internalization-related competence protein ComEC/Rec2 [Caldalkalibacillus thermarum TA2.A1]|uniref:DNA internalization-related competence protein ComEC/Rec2 n=1 Tax=Caldalkalibacillus thermarum (strain TA2.A1) TaxID=986075 RepID=F5L8Q9_CALTT|nr:DNA internalization-related competence protein ComEC/Rec2 [Caldalkalibacillus thermarum]EGL82298.1 DNA internalization-related competence protein ComEC/Rec2 [Caldalkalibacillus thermarum TA2.A1]QZT33411.1 DNA internalization-related competence protein ComEC/Rec2 [Caldalkalibacillus thermarum TA2.A1]
MLELATYFIVLFTLQLMVILQGGSSWWFNLIWASFFVALFLGRDKLYYPPDHPHVKLRRQNIRLWLGLFILLIFFNLYFSIYVATQHQSAITSFFTGQVFKGGSAWEEKRLDHMAHINQRHEHVTLKGTIRSAVDIDGNRVRFDLKVETINGSPLSQAEKVAVTHFVRTLKERERYIEVQRGDEWEGVVELTRAQPARNPGAFDYRRYLQQRGIHYTAYVRDLGNIRSRPGVVDQLLNRADQYRLKWIGQTEALFGEQTASIVQAMTVGYRDELDRQVLEMYQQLGIVHLLAISGLHVGIVLGCLYLLLSRLPLTRETIYLILFLVIPVYIMLSGWQVSVVRAGLMAMAVLICFFFRLRHHSLVGLYVVYILILMVNPYYLYHAGFQLSFATTFALITVVPKLYPLLPGKSERLQQAVAVAVVAQAVSLPVVMYHFYSFSPLALLINLILVPLYSVVYIPGAFGLTLVSFFSLDLIRLPAWAYEESLNLLHRGLEWLYRLPWATVNTGQPGWWWLILAFVLLVILGRCAELRQKGAVGLVLACFSCLLVLQPLLPYLDRQGYVMVLDVGQGDAIVIEAPYRREVVLIDLGGQLAFYQEEWQRPSRTFETGRDVILPYLRYRGINQVDKVIVSHGHYDHFGGIQGLLGHISIGMVLYPPVMPQSDFERLWLTRIQEKGIPLYHVSKQDHWGNNEIQFLVLHPPLPQGGLAKQTHNLHDYNLVLWNKIYDTTFIWTGDVEEPGEYQMLDAFPWLQADVLKVAHHGSHTSTSEPWLAQIKPQVSVVSVGGNNRYGHPDREVIRRLAESGAPLFRTDHHGGILIVIRPGQYSVVPTLQADREQVQ